MLREEFAYALERKNDIGFCFKIQCVQSHLSALYSPLYSSQAGRDHLVSILVSQHCLFFIKKFGEFKQLKHLSSDLATPKIIHLPY